MMHFYEYLKNVALMIINQKSIADDVKAARDLDKISDTIQRAEPTETYITDAKELDAKIYSEYPEIEALCKVASVMQQEVVTNQKKRELTELDGIVNNLIMDEFGILASVLIKHGEIKTVKEFIERVE